MSFSRATKIRLPTIKQGLILGQTLKQIADECKVTERTINRDKEAWVKSPDFENWLRSEWMRFHLLVGRTDPVEAYRQLSKMVGKQIAQRVVSESVSYSEIRLKWDEPDSNDKVQASRGAT